MNNLLCVFNLVLHRRMLQVSLGLNIDKKFLRLVEKVRHPKRGWSRVLVDMGTFSLHSACRLSNMQIIRRSRLESSFQTVIMCSATHRQDTKRCSSYAKLDRCQRNSFVERRFLIRTWGRIKNLWNCYKADWCKLGRNDKTWLDAWYSNRFLVKAFWRWAINKSNQVSPPMKMYM